MKSSHSHTPRRLAARQLGLSMIELLVALAIGSILIAGAVFVYMQSRNSYAVNDSVSRLQETARFAMSVIEPDVRMGGNWGLLNDPELVTGRAAQTAGAVLPGNANKCGTNFAVDLFTTIEGTNAGYTFGVARQPACNPNGAGAQANTDTLIVRRATGNPVAATAGRVQVWSTRTSGGLFTNGAAPAAAVPPGGQVNDVIVNAYYISRDSDGRPGVPSLRRKSLVAGPDFQDQEIVSGVEDLQVQFGIDPTGSAGIATRYVNPGAALPVGTQIVAVRLWIMTRADATEVGYRDTTNYQYANRNFTPNDAFRRVLFTRTIQLRNRIRI
ncbi:MAG TPA: PilW family protein [Steroidobacteraceae bacterium]|nr:PilW family protein [Steroidobacteraceae bacterium]